MLKSNQVMVDNQEKAEMFTNMVKDVLISAKEQDVRTLKLSSRLPFADGAFSLKAKFK